MDLSGTLLMDAQTFLAAAGPGQHWETEVIHFVTTNISGNMQSWTVTKTCYILGWWCSASSNFHLAKNITPPTSLNTTAGVYNGAESGYIWEGGAAAGNQTGGGFMSKKLIAGDLVNLRITSATQTHLYLLIGFLVGETPSGTT